MNSVAFPLEAFSLSLFSEIFQFQQHLRLLDPSFNDTIKLNFNEVNDQ